MIVVPLVSLVSVAVSARSFDDSSVWCPQGHS